MISINLRNARHLVATTLLLTALSTISGCAEDSDPSSTDTAPVSDSTAESDDPAALYAQEMGIENPPDVEVVREVSPSEELPILVDCLTEAGFPPETPADVSIPEWQIPEAQVDAFNLAEYTCKAQYPLAAQYTEPLEGEQLGVVYDFWLTETIPCLADLGYEVEEPPSRDVFIAGEPWDPRESTYEQVMADISAGRWVDEEQVYSVECTTTPPDDLLYNR